MPIETNPHVDSSDQSTAWNVEQTNTSSASATTAAMTDATPTTLRPEGWYKDDNQVSEGVRTIANPNTQAGKVVLVPPSAFVPEIPDPKPLVLPGGSSYNKAEMDKQYLDLFDKNLASKVPPVPIEIQRLVRFLQSVPDGDLSSLPQEQADQVRKLLADVTQETEKSLKDAGLVPQGWTPPVGDPAVFNDLYDSAFGAALNDYVKTLNLPAADADKKLRALRFAFYHPEQSTSETNDIINEIKAGALTYLEQKGLTVPDNFKSSSADYDLYLKDSYDSSFETLVDGLVDDKGVCSNPALDAYIKQKTAGLSADEAQTMTQQILQRLKTLHYHPEMAIVDSGILGPIVAQLESSASDKVSSQEGGVVFLSGWLQPNTAAYDSKIQTDFQFRCEQKLHDILQTQSPPLSLDSVKALRNYMADSSVDTPDALKAIADKIKSDVTGEMMTAYGFPATWAPTGPAVWAGDPIMLNSLMTMTELQGSMQRQIGSMPDGSSKVLMLDYLKAIGDAISALQAQIYEIQQKDTEASSKYATAVSEARQGQIKKQEDEMAKQKAKMEELQKQQEKSNTISNVMKYVGPIAAVLAVVATVATLGTLGPLAIAIVLGATAMMAADSCGATIGGKSLSESFYQDAVGYCVQQALSLVGCNDPRVAQLVGACIVFVVITALTLGSGTGIAATAVGSQIITSSGMTRNAALLGGASEEEALYASLAVAGACIIVTIGVGMRSAQPGGGLDQLAEETMGKMGNTMNQISETTQAIQTTAKTMEETGRTAELIAEQAGLIIKRALLQFQLAVQEAAFTILKEPLKLLQGATRFTNFGIGCMTATNGYFTVLIDKINIDLVDVKKEMELNSVSKQAIIDQLMEMIKELQKIADQMNALLKGGQDLQVKKYEAVKVDFPA